MQLFDSGRVVRFLLLVPLLLLVAGCDFQTIQEVKADPYRYQDRDVHLRGEVVRSFGVLQYGLYELRDETGTIYVVSERGAPGQGARLQLKGRTLTAFVLAGVDYGTVIREHSRKIHRR